MSHRITRTGSITAVIGVGLLWAAATAAVPDERSWDEQIDGPLPRWREGGSPPDDPRRSLVPYEVRVEGQRATPVNGLIESPPEYAPMSGVIFRYSSSTWPGVVVDCVAALTGDPAHDEVAHVVVSSSSQQSVATSQFIAAGADMSKVQFTIMPTNSIWLRDYGPHFIWQGGAQAIADSHYYPSRPLDNFIPTLVGDDYLDVPTYDMGLYYSGGNFQPGPGRSGFVTSLIHQDNPGFGEPYIAELYERYQGIDSLHIMPRMPTSVDSTGHIDMWLYMVDEDTVIISEFIPGSNATAIQITEDAVLYMEGLGFEVFRVPALNGYHPYTSNCHFTYTNAFRVNDRIFVPTYGSAGGAHVARDVEALAAFQAAAPEAEIVPIDSYDIIYAAGAIHCIVMQVPRFTGPAPAVHLVSPAGGDLLVAGTAWEIRWAATDDRAVSAIDLAYSLDGGATFPHVIAAGLADTGQYTWTVPDAVTLSAVVRVAAHDQHGNVSEAQGNGAFQITGAFQSLYDFSTGAGVDRWGWGYQTSSWLSVSGTRHPTQAGNEISANSYARLAASDATGGDSDANRYIAPSPSSSYETTHVFEFTIAEDPATILDIELLWEGYGDTCIQMELYPWDLVQGDWCDGVALFGENRYLDNYAGNRDRVFSGHIRDGFDRFIDAGGRFTFLLYGERSGQESFHDYMAVVVTHRALGDINGDGQVNIDDLTAIILGWGPCPDPPVACPADTDGNGVVDVDDLSRVILDWT